MLDDPGGGVGMADWWWWWSEGWSSSPKIAPVARQMVAAKSGAGGADSMKPWRARRRLGARLERGPRRVEKKWRAVDRMAVGVGDEGAGGRVVGWSRLGLGRFSGGLSGDSQGEDVVVESGEPVLSCGRKLVVLSGLPHDEGLAWCVEEGGD